ncbi:MAG: hypothetical protein PHN64_04110 [Desulfovibrionaceae bacterium]|nr:hypothetical protein [Desulfovibrionaceae bacterium]
MVYLQGAAVFGDGPYGADLKAAGSGGPDIKVQLHGDAVFLREDGDHLSIKLGLADDGDESGKTVLLIATPVLVLLLDIGNNPAPEVIAKAPFACLSQGNTNIVFWGWRYSESFSKKVWIFSDIRQI